MESRNNEHSCGRDGILLVDKPADVTSYGVIRQLKRRFSFKKIGHAGTLDPIATGLLVVLVGKATKASSLIMAYPKTYEGSMRLGVQTDTLDTTGQIVQRLPVPTLTSELLQDLRAGFVGSIEQQPPMYSAVKVGGKRLYELARKGQEVQRDTRTVVVYQLEFTSWSRESISFSVTCSKGTYIRSLCDDIGARLGSCATMSSLRRCSTGSFDVGQSWNLEQLLAMDQMEFEACLISVPAERPER